MSLAQESRHFVEQLTRHQFERQRTRAARRVDRRLVQEVLLVFGLELAALRVFGGGLLVVDLVEEQFLEARAHHLRPLEERASGRPLKNVGRAAADHRLRALTRGTRRPEDVEVVTHPLRPKPAIAAVDEMRALEEERGSGHDWRADVEHGGDERRVGKSAGSAGVEQKLEADHPVSDRRQRHETRLAHQKKVSVGSRRALEVEGVAAREVGRVLEGAVFGLAFAEDEAELVLDAFAGLAERRVVSRCLLDGLSAETRSSHQFLSRRL